MTPTPLPVGAIAKRAQSRLTAGHYPDAAADLTRLTLAMPENSGALRLLAGVEAARGRIGASAGRYQWLFVLEPADLSLVREALSLPPEAGVPPARIRRLLTHQPDVARGYAVLGAGADREHPEGALRAAVLAPEDPTYLALAAAQRQVMGEGDRARRLARRALLLAPATVDAFLILAEDERSLGNPERALTLARRALSVRRNLPAAWITAAIAAHRLSRFEEATDLAQAAAALNPRDAGLAARAATLLPHIVTSHDQMHAIRAGIEALVESDGYAPIVDPIREVGTVPFSLAYHGINDRALLQRLAAFYRRVCPMLTMTAPHVGRTRRPGRRRVAFVSEFFRNHSVYNMTEGHLRLLDRTEIEVSVVQIGPLPETMRARIETVAERVLALPADLVAVRESLAALELDVLVFADIGMTAMSYFLAFARLAPLQIVLPGHPVTTGIDTVDVFFTSAWMEPQDPTDHYSETPHRVDGLAIAYAAERVRNQPVARADVGLPDTGALYLCGQMPFKIHPDFDRVIGDILARDPTGTIAVFEAAQDFRRMTEPLLARMHRSNVDRPEVMQRLTVLPRLPLERYLGLMRRADVILDTFHFSGGNTTMQSLALGQPLIAWPTEMMRGRVAAAPLRQMGMEDALLATSPQDYVERALAIAGNREHARDLRARLEEAAGSLIDSDAAARSLSRLIMDGRATG